MAKIFDKRLMCAAGFAALLACGSLAVPAREAAAAPALTPDLTSMQDSTSLTLATGAVNPDAAAQPQIGSPISTTADDGADLQGIQKNTFTLKAAGTYHQSEARRVLDMINQARARVGASPLAWDSGLELVACQRALELVLTFDHTRPNGQVCFTAAQELGVSWGGAVGENIAWGYPTPESVNTGWTNSPGHYSNMVNTNFTSVGISCVEVNGSRYWVEFFGATGGTGMSAQPLDGVYSTVMECLPKYINAAFYDVNVNDWYLRDPTLFLYTLNNGLMNGYGNGKFGPYDSITRGQVAAILHTIAGRPAASSPDFADVNYGLYYGPAIRWARSTGVISGYGDTNKFGPDDPVTREQLAAMLSNFAKKIAHLDVSSSMSKASGYSDWGQVSGWAREAMAWAVDKGMISGNTDANGRWLTPGNGAWRASMATMVAKFHRDILGL